MALSFSFKADGSQYSRGLDKMRAQTKAFSGSVGTMLKGLFAASLIVAAKRFADRLDRIAKLAKRLRGTTDEIQRIGFAAELAGSSLEEFANAVVKAQRKAAEGTDTTRDAFKALGIEMDSFSTLSPTEALIALEKGFVGAGGDALALSNLFKIAEDDAKKLTQAFNESGTGMEDAFSEAAVVSGNMIKQAENLNDTITKLKNTLTGWASSILTAFKVVVAGMTQSALEVQTIVLGVATAVRNVAKGDLKGAKTTFDNLADNAEGAAARIKKAVADVVAEEAGLNGKSTATKQVSPEDAKANALAEERIALVDKIKKAEDALAKARRDALSDEMKLNEIIKEREELKKGITADAPKGGAEDLKNLETQKKLIELEKEKSTIQDRIGKRITDGVNDKIKIEIGRTKEKQEAAKKKKDEDDKKAESDRLANLDPQRTVVTTSLAAAGLGGNTAAFQGDPALVEAERQSKLLEEIAKNTKPPGGTPETPEI